MKNTVFQKPLSPAAGFVAEAASNPDLPRERGERPDAFRFYKLAAAADDVTGPARAVLWVLAHHADYRSGRCFLHRATIAREAGISWRSVWNATQKLIELGIITKAKGRKRHSNEQGANVYTFAERCAESGQTG